MRFESFLSLLLAYTSLAVAAGAPPAPSTGEAPPRKAWDQARARHEGAGPVLWIGFPRNETFFRHRAIRYAGCVESGTKVSLNGSPLDVYPTGAFVGRFVLRPGRNRLEFCATRGGRATRTVREIERRARLRSDVSPSPKAGKPKPSKDDAKTSGSLVVLSASDSATTPVSIVWDAQGAPSGVPESGSDLPSSGTIRRRARVREKSGGPLAGLWICLDPGHGGRDTGAIGAAGLCESDANLAIARRLASLLKRQGARVTLTRNDDEYVSIEDRLACARRAGADLFLAIHNNDVSLEQDPLDLRGPRVFYFHDFSEEPARRVAEAFGAMSGDFARQVSFKRRVYRLTSTLSEIPSVLVECAYLSHPEDEMLLLDPAFLDTLADTLYKGIDAFFNTPLSPRPSTYDAQSRAPNRANCVGSGPSRRVGDGPS